MCTFWSCNAYHIKESVVYRGSAAEIKGGTAGVSVSSSVQSDGQILAEVLKGSQSQRRTIPDYKESFGSRERLLKSVTELHLSKELSELKT